MQLESSAHFTGQVAAPVHTKGAHEGVPGLPALSTLHCPTEPARLHESQAPSQLALQHTPSVQEPLAHCRGVAQTAPLASFGTHPVPLQNAVGVHCRSSVQLLGQVAEPPQR